MYICACARNGTETLVLAELRLVLLHKQPGYEAMAEYAFWKDETARAHGSYIRLGFSAPGTHLRVSAVCEASLPLAKNALHSPANIYIYIYIYI